MDMKGKMPPRAPESTQNQSSMAAPIVPKGSQSGHYVTDGANHTKPLSQSEKNFLEGQKVKEKIAKKTGVYPNTAN